jgi:Tfp pilus assembly protein PilF
MKFEETGDGSWIDRGLDEARRVAAMEGLELLGVFELGRIQLEAGDFDGAIDAFGDATRIAGWSDVAFLELGSAYEAAGRLEEAEAAYQSAISRRPDNASAHQWLGFLYWTSNRFDAAANQFRRVTEVAPNNPDGYNNYGGVLATLGRRDEALEVFRRSLAVQPTGVAYSQLGTLHFIASRFGSAAEMLEKAVELAPDDFDLLVNLAASYHWGGRRDQALQVYSDAVAVGEARVEDDAEDLVLLTRLASCHAMIGNHERALALLAAVAAREPAQARVAGMIAEAYEDLGERERALEWIGRALGMGLGFDWIEERPSLSRLVEDPRFRSTLDDNGS